MDGSWPLSVAVAPPGAGKSTQARRAIAALTRTGTLRRVVWMTPGTLSRNGVASLADEARADFLACGVPAAVIYGRAHFTRLNPDAVGEKRRPGRTFQAQYLEQFTWPQGPSVKLMSHAHLPVLYGAAARRGAEGAAARMEVPDLVVIDEDPGSSLVRSSPSSGQPATVPLSSPGLLARPSGTPLVQALLTLMEQVMTSSSPARVVGRSGGRTVWSWSGATFTRALRDALGTGLDAGPGFQTLLPQHDRWAAPFLAHAVASGLDTHALGLHWETRGRSAEARPGERSLTFRYDVLATLPGLPPTVLLDAYGDRYDAPGLRPYHATVLGRPVRMVHLTAAPARSRLEVAHTPQLALSRAGVRCAGLSTPTGQRAALRVDAVMRKIVLFTAGQVRASTVVLCYRDMIGPLTAARDRVLAERRDDRAGRAGLPPTVARPEVEITFQHYFAGRGKNENAGRHIVAVVAPHRPRRYAEHTLAALYPDDRGRRLDLAVRQRDVELLQMLHRNRQLTHDPGCAHAPRTLVAFTPPPTLGMDLVQVHLSAREAWSLRDPRPFPARRTVQWEGVLGIAASELSELLDGIPVLALMALGLLQVPGTYRALVDHVERRLRGKVRTNRHPHLWQWKTDRDHFRHGLGSAGEPVSPRRSDDRATLERSLSELLQARRYRFVQPGGVFPDALRAGQLGLTVPQPSRLRVWSRDEVQAGALMVRLLS